MAKYEVLCDCYGFEGKYWEKGAIVDIDPKENPPEHFKLLSDSTIVPKEKAPQESITLSRQAKLEEAEKLGIKDAELLTAEELQIVTQEGVSRQKINAVVQKARARQKQGK